MAKYYNINYILIIICLFTSLSTSAKSINKNKAIKILDSELAKAEMYSRKKESLIDSIKNTLDTQETTNDTLKVYECIFDEYKSFQYDSALVYANKFYKLSSNLNGINKDQYHLEGKEMLIFCYMSAGLFKEAFDIIDTINYEQYNSKTKAQGYVLITRLYYDMSDYVGGSLSKKYINLGNHYANLALPLLPINSYEYLATLGLQQMQGNNFEGAERTFISLLDKKKNTITAHQYAVVTSSLGYIYGQMGKPEKSFSYLTQAALKDIQSATKETVAFRELANLLYQDGEIDKANTYIKFAMDNANFYNSRHRKLQISTIQPIIAKVHGNLLEKEKNRLIVTMLLIVTLLISTAAFSIIIYRQYKKLAIARQDIQNKNDFLNRTNTKLAEAIKIKDEFIIQSLCGNYEHINQQSKLFKSIKRQVKLRHFDSILHLIKEVDLKNERDDIHKSFDITFLKLIPNFIDGYNSLFPEEHKVHIDSNHVKLTVEMRIFALIRLGIHDNEKLAELLNYSVNTINTYKTKVKNRSSVDNNQFEQQIMNIGDMQLDS